MNLPAKYKLAWLWVLDNCDHAGIAEVNPRLMEFMIGEPIDADEFLRVMQGRVTKPKPGKWFVRRFIEFQYGETLSRANSAHRGVLRKLAEAGVESPVKIEEAPAKGLDRACQGPQDKDKDKDKDTSGGIGLELEGEPKPKPAAKGAAKDPTQLRVEALMRRRPTTPLSPAEAKAYKAALPAILAMQEADWQAMEAFYAAPQSETFTRKDLLTLLNNWNGEVDRARNWKPKAGDEFGSVRAAGWGREIPIDRSQANSAEPVPFN